MNIGKFFRNLGPGLLYAGAAVGVSHLVQSTRAGASYGFDLALILILANIIKYPFFEFGPRYAISTGKSLVHGYYSIGKWALWIFLIITVLSMFAIQAAVTVVTAGLCAHIFHLSLNPVAISAIILAVSLSILFAGRYSLLDKAIKYIIVLLTLSTVVAVIYALGQGNQNIRPGSLNFNFSSRIDLLFLIAFIGWMPAPIDVSVWHSLWSNAKNKSLGHSLNLRQSLLDFKIGYWGTAFLAFAFLSLGALIMYGSGESLSPKGSIFAAQLIKLYTSSIGQWSYYLIAIAALTSMFSTTLSCMDAYPRVLVPAINLITTKETYTKRKNLKYYRFWMLIILIGTIVLMAYFSSTMRFLVDLATTISFVTAPLFAYLNYKVVTDDHMPSEGKPGKRMRIYSVAGIIFLSIFSLFYIVWIIL